jgi:hypothetical protein
MGKRWWELGKGRFTTQNAPSGPSDARSERHASVSEPVPTGSNSR